MFKDMSECRLLFRRNKMVFYNPKENKIMVNKYVIDNSINKMMFMGYCTNINIIGFVPIVLLPINSILKNKLKSIILKKKCGFQIV